MISVSGHHTLQIHCQTVVDKCKYDPSFSRIFRILIFGGILKLGPTVRRSREPQLLLLLLLAASAEATLRPPMLNASQSFFF